jgi:hypothetical protein
MPQTYQKLFGLDWPRDMPLHQIHLMLARYKLHVPRYMHALGMDPGDHMIEATRLLFEPHEFQINPWTERTMHAYCNHNLVVLMGPAASSKSHTCGMIALLDWLVAPRETSTFFASTTKAALERRSWNSILEFFQVLKKKGAEGVISKSRGAVINDDDVANDAGGYDVKSGIFGVAVLAGTLQDALSNTIGVHQPSEHGGVRMFADEAQAIKQAFVDARFNLSIGTPDFRIVLMGNPMSFHDPLANLAEPVGGWNSVTIEDEGWDTKSGGVCIHFDGHKSPALKDPAKYRFLINQKQLNMLKKANQDNELARDYLTMGRGWVANESDFDVVLPMSAINKFNMEAEPVWDTEPTCVAGLDPAYTRGGDDCVLQIAYVGHTTDGVLSIGFGPTHKLKISDSTDTPVTYQLMEQVRDYSEVYGFTPETFACDDSTTQNLVDVLEMEWGRGTLRKDFGSKASDMPVSEFNPASCREHYRDTVTELWYTVREFGLYGQIKGLPTAAKEEFSQRRVLPKRPRQLEPKSGTVGVPGMKQRLRRSPDTGDACSLCAAVARERLGAHPGATRARPLGAVDGAFSPENFRMLDLNHDPSAYLSTGF